MHMTHAYIALMVAITKDNPAIIYMTFLYVGLYPKNNLQNNSRFPAEIKKTLICQRVNPARLIQDDMAILACPGA